jgi:hypothetical protein
VPGIPDRALAIRRHNQVLVPRRTRHRECSGLEKYTAWAAASSPIPLSTDLELNPRVKVDIAASQRNEYADLADSALRGRP